MSDPANQDQYGEIVVRRPEIMNGLPTIRGTRIPVYMILEMIEAGLSMDDIGKEYPHLTRDQIQAAIHYACELAAK